MKYIRYTIAFLAGCCVGGWLCWDAVWAYLEDHQDLGS